MPLPDTDRVTKELDARFAAPLPDYYARRIIFWYDGDRDFAEKVAAGEFVLENARLIALTGTNTFEVKKLLSHDDLTHNFCVYCPFEASGQGEGEEDWLLPVELYSETFRSDLISIWMEEMGIPGSARLREVVKQYRSFFKTKAHRTKVAALHTPIATAAQLLKAVMAVLCGLKETGPDAVLRTVLSAGAEEDNAIFQSFVKYGLDAVLWRMAAQMTGYQAGEPKLFDLACHIFLTAASRTLPLETLPGLSNFISPAREAYCYDFLSEWMGSGERESLYAIAHEVEEALRLSTRFQQFSARELMDTDTFPCVDVCILGKIMGNVAENRIDVAGITEAVEKRRTLYWYGLTEHFYDGLLELARMQQFYLDHAAGFHIVEPAKLWKAYTEDYFRMDTYYRHFQAAYGRVLQSSNEELDDGFKRMADVVEHLYVNWFLEGLSDCWTRAMGEALAEYGYISGIPRQENFYRDCVKTAGTRVFVIISDALRYEVAAALAESLRQDTRAEVKLSGMEGVFPTITKFGMAALLPHRELSVASSAGQGVKVLADGRSTDAPARESVLKAAEPSSAALKYDDSDGGILRMRMEERRNLVRGKQVVYLYHNRIDKAGHELESGVVRACDETVRDIRNLVHIITNEFGGTRIFITADHGFLYTREALAEDGRVDKTTESRDDVEVGRRYLITRKGAVPDYLLPVTFAGSGGFDAFTPGGITRIRMKGGGLTFVHGGISPEELVVPLVEYHYVRSSSTAYLRNKKKYDTEPVELVLTSATRKISNMIFSLQFYQKEPVGDKRTAAAYRLYFVDPERTKVSDVQKVIADKTSENSQDRIFRVNFNLKAMKFDSHEPYALVIEEESGGILPREEAFTIDIPFAMDDFDFFG